MKCCAGAQILQSRITKNHEWCNIKSKGASHEVTAGGTSNRRKAEVPEI